MTSRLDSAQSDWVEVKVKDGFEPSKAVNSVLLQRSGVPAMPKQDQVIRMAQAALAGKKAAVDFMMDAKQGERPGFIYQTKLVVPSDQRVEIARVLLNGQPKTMRTRDHRQLKVWIRDYAEQHLTSRPSRVVSPTWYWEIGQGEQMIETQQRGDDSRFALSDRAGKWSRSRTAGMRGTDLPTWATLMAAGIRHGSPPDVRFKRDARNTKRYEEWNFTVLDEEGEFTAGACSVMVGGCFLPEHRRPYLEVYNGPYGIACFRSWVDGPIKA